MGWLAGRLEEPGKASLAPYLHIQVSPGGGRRVGVGADGGAGVDVIRAEVVYGVADAAADGAAVIPAVKTKKHPEPRSLSTVYWQINWSRERPVL